MTALQWVQGLAAMAGGGLVFLALVLDRKACEWRERDRLERERLDEAENRD